MQIGDIALQVKAPYAVETALQSQPSFLDFKVIFCFVIKDSSWTFVISVFHFILLISTLASQICIAFPLSLFITILSQIIFAPSSCFRNAKLAKGNKLMFQLKEQNRKQAHLTINWTIHRLVSECQYQL